MRLNQFISSASLLSRRAADTAIAEGRVTVDGRPAQIGELVEATSVVTLDGTRLTPVDHQIVMLHKPTGYVCSTKRQGNNPTIYELLPPELHHLVSVGRLDKDSSGLLLLTNDGQLTNQLTHPRYGKTKRYRVTVTPQPSSELTRQLEAGVELEDGPSQMKAQLSEGVLTLELGEGRNRQIRRTLAALGYQVRTLHRDRFGALELGDLPAGQTRVVLPTELA